MANKLTDDDLISILRKEEQVGQRLQQETLQDLREQAYRAYDRKPYGDEEAGHSSVVTSEVADTVESMMPALMRVFASGDDISEFTPVSQSDEQAAREASQYVPHVFMRENDGFRILYWFFKDALLHRLATVIVDTETVEKTSRVPVEAWTDEQMAMAEEDARAQGATEIAFDVEADPMMAPPMVDPMDPMAGMPMAPVQTFSGTMTIVRRTERVVIDNVAPEDLLISPAEVRDIDEASYVGYRKQVTASDLRVLGMAQEDIDALSTDRNAYSIEEEERQDGLVNQNNRKDSERRLWLVVAYVRADDNGDGISEMLRVVYAHAGGMSGAIIERMEWEDGEAPITIGSAILMPHNIIGRSLYDQTADLQDIGTALTRGMLDNLYLTNRPRPAVNDRVDILSVLDYTPGMPIKVKGADNPNSAVSWMQVPSVIGPALSGLEYMNSVRENRTGISRYNQGLDADSLNKTASGINNIMSAAQQRQELMARVLANTAVSRLMRHIYRAIKRIAKGPVQYYANGDWQQSDPTRWPDDMQLIVAVGTGTGNKMQEVQNLLLLGSGQEKLVQAQGGLNGPMVKMEHIANTFRKLAEAAGFRASSQFVASQKDVSQAQQQQAGQPPPPPPELLKAQAEIEIMRQKAEADIQIKMMEAQAKIEIERAKAGIDAQLKREELASEAQLKAFDIATAPRPNIPEQQVGV
jgi:hypothetical protein